MNDRLTSSDVDAEKLATFSFEEWQEWLAAFLNSRPCQPSFPIGSGHPHAALQGICSRLGIDACGKFKEAIVCLYESLRYEQQEAPLIYNLLHTIGYAKPFRAKGLLTRDLLDEVLLGSCPGGLRYKDHNLHQLLLSVRGEYAIDATLIDYMFNSARRTTDFSFLLLCFQLLASSGGEEAYQFLSRIIANISSKDLEAEAQAQDLALELAVEFTGRAGYRQFFLWFSNRSNELASRFRAKFAHFERALKLDALPSPAIQASTDDLYLRLLGLQLYENRYECTARRWIRLARLHEQIGAETTENMILSICGRNYPDWSHETPFRFIYKNDLLESKLKLESKQKRDGKAIIVTIDDDSADFDAENEPVLVEIFDHISTFFTLAQEPLKTAAAAAGRGRTTHVQRTANVARWAR